MHVYRPPAIPLRRLLSATPRTRIVGNHVVRAMAAVGLLSTMVAVGSPPVAAAGPCGVPAFSGDANRIGNLVFLDTDDDGSFEPADGESGLAGVGLELWNDVDLDGAFEPTGDDLTGLACSTSTDATGHYWFHDVASGSYFVAVSGGVPAGHVSSTGATVDAITDNRDDGGPVGSYPAVTGVLAIDVASPQPTGETSPGGAAGADETAANAATVTFPDTDSNLTIDLGFAPVATSTPCLGIGNRIWLDLDNDGSQETGEPGINGVTVQLFAADGAGDPTGAVLATVTTVDGGYYLFSCVGPGDYVVVVPSTNFAPTGPLSGLRSSPDGALADQRDHGRDPATVGANVNSAAITLSEGGEPVNEPDKPAGGTYDFDDPRDNDVNTEIDFGFSGLTVGNRVWMESTVNGIQDAGEPGIAGVTVELWTANGDGPVGAAPIASTTTDADGYYLFTGLNAGDYVARIPAGNFAAGNPLAGKVSTSGNGKAPDVDTDTTDRDDNGDGDGSGPVDTLPFTLANGTEPTGEPDVSGPMDSFPSDNNANVTVDFGFVDSSLLTPDDAALGDKVWVDTNRDGIQDAGESPVATVTVRLRDANDNVVATTTDINGIYGFGGLPAGTYRVCFDLTTLPQGMIPTTSNAGNDDAVDSDADAEGCTQQVVLAEGDENLTLDLGIHRASVDLAIDKSGSYRNSKVTWTLVVENKGPDTEPGHVTVIDNLPDDVSYESAAGTGFDCVYTAASHSVSCTYTGSLAPNARATVTIVTTMKSATDCTVTNTASVKGAGIDTTAANNADSASLTNACAAGETQRRLPSTGTTTAVLGALALLLGIGGWKLTGVSSKLKAIRLKNRIGD